MHNAQGHAAKAEIAAQNLMPGLEARDEKAGTPLRLSLGCFLKTGTLRKPRMRWCLRGQNRAYAHKNENAVLWKICRRCWNLHSHILLPLMSAQFSTLFVHVSLIRFVLVYFIMSLVKINDHLLQLIVQLHGTVFYLIGCKQWNLTLQQETLVGMAVWPVGNQVI